MLNINELERQWLDYKKRILKPYLIGGILLALLFISLLLFWSFFNNESPQNIPQQITQALPEPTVHKPVTVKKEPILTPVQLPKKEHQASIENNTSKAITPLKKQVELKKPKIIKQKKEPQELRPSFAFIDTIKPSKPKPKKGPKRPKKKSAPKEKKVQKRSPVPLPTPMTTEATDDKMLSLRKRFERTKNPTLGTVITRLYFEKKAYELSYKYALEVNAIDETNIHSWLYAAKSLYFLGKKDKAINMLQQYIKKTHSNSAQKLLSQIRSGTLQ